MSDAFVVNHPVPCLHRPPRAKAERLSYLTGSTSVEIRGFSGPPVEIVRMRGAPIVEADGRAWMPARHRLVGGPVRADDMREVLLSTEARVGIADRPLGDVRGYLIRSPICWMGDGLAGRSGDLEAPPPGWVDDGASERAGEAVREFVADRIRLHEGEVYLRYERLLSAWPLHTGYVKSFPPLPRTTGGTAMYRRSEGWARLDYDGEDWEAHERIPVELLDDDDALWFANVLPERLLSSLMRPALRGHLDEERREGLKELIRDLTTLEWSGRTLAFRGERLPEALATVRDAAQKAADFSGVAAERSRMMGYFDDMRCLANSADVLRRQVIPELATRRPPDREDGQALAGLGV